MPLPDFVFFFYGILAEIALLFEGAHPEARHSGPLLPSIPLVGRVFSPIRQVVLALGGLAGLLAALFTLSGVGEKTVYIDTPVINLFFIALGLFVVAAAFMVILFLPPVNEQSILAVQVLILLNALAGGRVDWIPLAALTAVPALVSLALLFWRRTFHPIAKALLYLWYLLSLLAMPFQSGQMAYFRAQELAWFESWAFGGLFIFMILHGLFAVRFFLIVSSLILPRNRPAVAPLMVKLFSDEHASPLRFTLVMVVTAGLVLLNQAAGLVAQPVMLGLCVMIVSQVLVRRSPNPALTALQ